MIPELQCCCSRVTCMNAALLVSWQLGSWWSVNEAADTDHFNESSTPLLFTNAVLHLTKCAKLFNTVTLALMKHHLRISLVLMTLRPGGGTSNAPSHSSDRFLSSLLQMLMKTRITVWYPAATYSRLQSVHISIGHNVHTLLCSCACPCSK